MMIIITIITILVCQLQKKGNHLSKRREIRTHELCFFHWILYDGYVVLSFSEKARSQNNCHNVDGGVLGGEKKNLSLSLSLSLSTSLSLSLSISLSLYKSWCFIQSVSHSYRHTERKTSLYLSLSSCWADIAHHRSKAVLDRAAASLSIDWLTDWVVVCLNDRLTDR